MNTVKDVPDAFKQWVSDNSDRLNKAEAKGSVPYFIKNNKQTVERIRTERKEAKPDKPTNEELSYMQTVSDKPETSSMNTEVETQTTNAEAQVTDEEAEAQAETERRERNRQLYEEYRNDPDYYDVEFDEASGGMKATHIGHNFDKKGGEYEKHVMKAGFNNGHSVIFESEPGTEFQVRYIEGLWDGENFEIAGRETASENNVLSGLKHCASKRTTKIAILDYPNGGFDEIILENAKRRYKGLEKLHDGQYLKFDKIICIQNEDIIFETEL